MRLSWRQLDDERICLQWLRHMFTGDEIRVGKIRTFLSTTFKSLCLNKNKHKFNPLCIFYYIYDITEHM